MNDVTTGLPELPSEWMRWRIDRDDNSLFDVDLILHLQVRREVEENSKRFYYSSNDRIKNYRYDAVYETLKEYYTGIWPFRYLESKDEKVTYWETIEYVKFKYTANKEIVNEANKLLNAFIRNAEIEAIVGNYPPKRLSSE